MFKKNVIKSFKAIKNDMTDLKTNLNEWLVFLQSNQKEMELELQILKNKVSMLEKTH